MPDGKQQAANTGEHSADCKQNTAGTGEQTANGPAGIKRFQDLGAWQEAHRLVLDVYRLTGRFPADEKFGLVSQMRRAAVSIPANLAEGFKKRGVRDKLNFYNIAQGSLEELKYYFILARDLGYAGAADCPDQLADRVSRVLFGLVSVIAHEDLNSARRS